jgi:outer membrane lipoprotein SlyB
MLTHRLSLLVLIPVLVLMTACGGVARRQEARQSNVAQAPINNTDSAVYYGRVSSIEVVDGKSSGVGGAVLGAVLGGVIGHQIGSGTGRDVATGLGAVGGALIGRNIQKRKESDIYRVVVTLDNGGTRSFDYQRIDDLGVGDRIKVEGGQLVRL